MSIRLPNCGSREAPELLPDCPDCGHPGKEAPPAYPVKVPLQSDVANEAGMSRRYGGIHFRAADFAGRLLGRLLAYKAWKKAQDYLDGIARPEVQQEAMSENSELASPPQ